MRLEFIDRVKENQILGKSIFTKEGQTLLKAGIRLTDLYISKLKSLGVFYIYIEDSRLEDVEVEDERLTEFKCAAMKRMSSVFSSLYNINASSFNETIKTVEDMIGYIVEMGDVNKSLYDIQTYDNYTFVHSLDTCIMSSFLGITSNIKNGDLKELGIGAALHDIGKIKVPIEILNKKGRLTKEEFEEIKKHPLYGSEILKKNFSISDRTIKAVEQHHERIDGLGYPYGLKEKQITDFGKIVGICDVYDAVSNDRVYRKKFNLNEAYELILSGSGSAFDKNMVVAFKNTFAIYPLGCHVKLSNNEDGYIIEQNRGFPDRPIIRIFNSKSGKYTEFHEVDLMKDTNITVTGLI